MKKKTNTLTERSFEVIRRPLITEKAMKGAEQGQVAFIVDTKATKTEIKTAVESLFGVKVTAVNTMNVAGKSKVFRGRKGQRSDYKKAIVSLADGQKIDVTTGI